MDNVPDHIRKHGPWWAKTWWGRRTTAINIGLVIAVLLFIVWKSLFP